MGVWGSCVVLVSVFKWVSVWGFRSFFGLPRRMSYPMVETASLYDKFCKTGNDVIYDVITWVQDGNCKKMTRDNFSIGAFYNITNKNSSGDEIANVNFFYNIAHVEASTYAH